MKGRKISETKAKLKAKDKLIEVKKKKLSKAKLNVNGI